MSDLLCEKLLEFPEHGETISEIHERLDRLSRYAHQNPDELSLIDRFNTVQEVPLLIGQIRKLWPYVVTSILNQATRELFLSLDEKKGSELFSPRSPWGRLHSKGGMDDLNDILRSPDILTEKYSDYQPLISLFHDIKGVLSTVPSNNTRKKMFRYLKEYINQDPASMQEILSSVHLSDVGLNGAVIDRLLGLNKGEIEKSIDFLSLFMEYDDESVIKNFTGENIISETDYASIRKLLHLLEPGKGDVVWDLGCAYSRLGIYGGLTTDATYKGVDIVAGRVEAALKVKDKFGVDNLTVMAEDVRNVDFSDGNIFYFYNPFFDDTLKIVGNKLREIAGSNGGIKIVSNNTSDDYFSKQKWLRRVYPLEEYTDNKMHINIYESGN